jgi:hypothetical protein
MAVQVEEGKVAKEPEKQWPRGRKDVRPPQSTMVDFPNKNAFTFLGRSMVLYICNPTYVAGEGRKILA